MGKQFASFEIRTDKCIGYFSATGGVPSKPTTTSTLQLEKPNGGENLVVGSDTTITWSGVAPSDIVSLEYTTDNGTTWHPIATSASNLKYVWKSIPKPISNECKIRIRQLSASSGSGTPGTIQFKLSGHTDFVYDVQWSPDGSKLTTASKDNTAIIWSAITGIKLFTLKGHTGEVSSVRWSPDGSKIATSSWDNTTIIWSAANGTKLLTLIGHTDFVSDVQWSPDGSKVATVSRDNTAMIWSITDGTALFTLKGHTEDVDAVQWSPDGSKLATASRDFTATIWSAINGTKLFTLTGHTGEVSDVKWSPDGSKVATASRDNSAIIWSAISGIILFTLSGHSDYLTTVQWSPDGMKIVTASEDQTAIVWSVTSGKNLLKLHDHTYYVLDVQWSPDGSKIATSSNDNTAKIWSSLDGKRIFTLEVDTLKIRAVQWSPDGSKVATTCDDGTAKIWFVENVDEDLQEDSCDALFSIVAPSPSSRDVDMRQCLVGNVRDSLVHSFVQNIGYYLFRVDSIAIVGADSSQFSLVSGISPFVVPANDSSAVEFRFAPTSTGIKIAQIIIFTQTDTLQQTIRGEGVAPSVSFTGEWIDFGTADIGKQQKNIQTFSVKNVGNKPLIVTTTRHAGPNSLDFSTIAGGGSFTLAQDETAKIEVLFSPKEIGRTSGRLLFDYNGIGSPATVQLYGEGTFNTNDTARTTIITQDIRAKVGEKVHLTLKLNKASGMEIVGAPTEWYARIHYNKSILFNEQTNNVCEGTTDSCVLELNGVYNPKTDELLSIPCIATLGNTDHSTIVIDTFFWKNSAIVTEVATQNGSITLNGVCEDGGVRLFIPAKNSTSLSTRPNPIQDNLQIQYGLREPLNVTLELLNMTGQVVQTIFRDLQMKEGQYLLASDLSTIGNGIYILQLTTNRGVLTTRVDVVK